MERKTNRLSEQILKSISQEIKTRVEKAMSCKWLINGNGCVVKGVCNHDGCLAWEQTQSITTLTIKFYPTEKLILRL